MNGVSTIFKQPLFVLRLVWRVLKNVVSFANPTKDWTKYPSREITVDLDSNTLCGVGLGEPVDRLKFLGRCKNFGLTPILVVSEGDGKMELIKQKDEDYSCTLRYCSLGIMVECDSENRIQKYTLTFLKDKNDPKMIPYSGPIVFGGQTLTVEDLDSADRLKNCLGEPDEIDDPPEVEQDREPSDRLYCLPTKSFEYQKRNARWSILFDENDRTAVLSIKPASDPQSC